jgi:hypothetical protein
MRLCIEHKRQVSEMNSYANAEKILPAELLKEVQQYHTGVLWIPTPSRF